MSRHHETGHEWISIADLMSGIVGVLVLMFVVAAVNMNEAQQKTKEALKQVQNTQREKVELEEQALAASERRRSGISSVFLEVKNEFTSRGLDDVVFVDPQTHQFILRDATFASGSACVREQAKAALRIAAPALLGLLNREPSVNIFIEGHTDALPLGTSASTLESACARFDDNYTLSTARARNARQVIVGDWAVASQDRVALAGFGPSRPLPGVGQFEASQRRVEISVRQSGTLSGP
jgi:chemotaxis protein MotB